MPDIVDRIVENVFLPEKNDVHKRHAARVETEEENVPCELQKWFAGGERAVHQQHHVFFRQGPLDGFMHRGACRLERRFPDRRKAVLENVVVDGSQVPHIKGNRVVRHLLFAEEFFVFADEHRIDFARPHILSPEVFLQR